MGRRSASRRFDFSDQTDMRRLNKGAVLDDARPPLLRFSNEAVLSNQGQKAQARKSTLAYWTQY
jgi:hypothetical protein